MKTFFKIVGVLILLGAAVYGYIFYTGYSQKTIISQQVTDFLQLASDGDTEGAYEFFTEDLKQAWPIEDLEDAFDKHFGRLEFVSQKQSDHYVFMGVKKGNIFKFVRFYEYGGIVTYTRNTEGEINAVFKKEKGDWKLISFQLGDPYPIY